MLFYLWLCARYLVWPTCSTGLKFILLEQQPCQDNTTEERTIALTLYINNHTHSHLNSSTFPGWTHDKPSDTLSVSLSLGKMPQFLLIETADVV